MAIKYYKTDSRKISFREYWNIVGTLKGFLRASFNKIIGRQMELTKGIPEPQPFQTSIVDSDAIPANIRAKLNQGILELKALGFDQFWYYTLKESMIGGAAYAVQALHVSRKTIGKIIYVSIRSRQNFTCAFLSELEDGNYHATTDKRQKFNPVPGCSVTRRINATLPELWDAHQQKLSALEDSGKSARSFSDFNQVADFEDKYSRINFNHKVARGIWVEMSDAEVLALKARIAGLKNG